MRRHGVSKTSETKSEHSEGEPTYLGDKSQEDQARSGERFAAVSRQVEAMASFKEFGPIIAAYSLLVFGAWIFYFFLLFYGHLFLSAESMLVLYEPYDENIRTLQGGNYSFEMILKEAVAREKSSDPHLLTNRYGDIFHSINIISTLIIGVTLVVMVCTYLSILPGVESLTTAFDPNCSRNVCLKCCIVAEVISFTTHLGLLLSWFPTVYSVWQRATHIILLGEWIAIAPFQIILLHTIDGITTVDLFSMWLSSCGQGLSTAFGIIAALTSDFLIANTTLILSLLLFSTIYMDLLRSYRHYAKYKHELLERRKNFAPRIIGLDIGLDQRKALRSFQLSRLYSLDNSKRIKGSADNDFIVHEILSQARLDATFNKFFFTLCCTISWSCLVVGQTLGRIGYISHVTECFIILASDVLSRCVFVILIYYAHSSFMTEEHILRAVQELETETSSVGTVCPFFSYDPTRSHLLHDIPFSCDDGLD